MGTVETLADNRTADGERTLIQKEMAPAVQQRVVETKYQRDSVVETYDGG